MADSTGQNAAREHLRAAKSGLQQVKGLLAQPTLEKADQAAAILRDVEVQLGGAAAVLEKNGMGRDGEFRVVLEDLQSEVATLAHFLAGTDRLLSEWLKTVQTKRGGYTHKGHAAPLVLVSKVAVEG